MEQYQSDKLSIPGKPIWRVDEISCLERQLTQSVPPILLMKKAAQAAFRFILNKWPKARHWLIICGPGNNGGDGYCIAAHARLAGYHVTVFSPATEKKIISPASDARQQWLDIGGEICSDADCWPASVDLIIDGLLGTGCRCLPSISLQQVITKINQAGTPILSLDIPSGLLADTGTLSGTAVRATATLTFLAFKPGLLTGKARDFTGQLHVASLGADTLPLYHKTATRCLDSQDLSFWVKPRAPTSHKGQMGKIVVIGGNTGTAGAVRLSGEAALRSGAGLVRVLTHSSNITPLLTARPELMPATLNNDNLEASLAWADFILIGPGLGNDDVAQNAIDKVKNSSIPQLWDADALNFLAITPNNSQNRILTPHPGEAARLLDCTVDEIEHDRLAAAQAICQHYGGIVVLKGAGTVIVNEQGDIRIVATGNPGMATAGMGDVLSGVIAAMVGQQLSLFDAACAAVVAHGAAADHCAAESGMRGLLASDLFLPLRRILNPKSI
jgi:ADP-dependent NAD(P)H-hydrate dehydratase / NAD(P)H-hydrate epimerase